MVANSSTEHEPSEAHALIGEVQERRRDRAWSDRRPASPGSHRLAHPYRGSASRRHVERGGLPRGLSGPLIPPGFPRRCRRGRGPEPPPEPRPRSRRRPTVRGRRGGDSHRGEARRPRSLRASARALPGSKGRSPSPAAVFNTACAGCRPITGPDASLGGAAETPLRASPGTASTGPSRASSPASWSPVSPTERATVVRSCEARLPPDPVPLGDLRSSILRDPAARRLPEWTPDRRILKLSRSRQVSVPALRPARYPAQSSITSRLRSSKSERA